MAWRTSRGSKYSVRNTVSFCAARTGVARSALMSCREAISDHQNSVWHLTLKMSRLLVAQDIPSSKPYSPRNSQHTRVFQAVASESACRTSYKWTQRQQEVRSEPMKKIHTWWVKKELDYGKVYVASTRARSIRTVWPQVASFGNACRLQRDLKEALIHSQKIGVEIRLT